MNGGVIGPFGPLETKGFTKEFRQQVWSYRLTLVISNILIWIPTWGLHFILKP